MNLTEYIGQKEIKEDIMVHIRHRLASSYPLEHTMLYGGAGLGKTTLVEIIAEMCEAKLFQKIGDELTKPILYEILKDIDLNNILFVDETHNIPIKVMEILYGPLQIINNLKLNKGYIQPFEFEGQYIQPFTFIGATTAPGMITKPLRDRIILSYQMQPYTPDDLIEILLTKGCKPNIAKLIAERSRGVPRVCMNYFSRIRNESEDISEQDCLKVFDRLGIDSKGFTKEDLRIIKYIGNNKVVSESELYRTLGIDRKDFVNMYEPFLLSEGILRITSRGRILSKKGERYYENL